VVALLLLSAANGSLQRQSLADSVGLLLAFAAFMVVGALIVAHRPGNAVGWVFSAIGLLAVTGALAEEYAGYGTVSLPGGVLAGWYAGWSWYPTVALVVVYRPLLFPDGRPPSPRWRPVAWLTGAGAAALVVLSAVQPTIELDDGHVVDNPVGVAAVGDPEQGAVGIAILRYRLYDIDRLINRTLVYGLLTALLGGVYAGLVLLAGPAVRRPGRPAAELGGGRGHPGRGRPVPAGPPAGPGAGRPALQPGPLRPGLRQWPGSPARPR
jgi:hypothetical protein